jgi:leucyl aminopeptidase
MKKILVYVAPFLFSFSAFGADAVLAPLHLLKQVGAPVEAKNEETDLAFTHLSAKWQEKLLLANHEAGKCGGFEVIPSKPGSLSGKAVLDQLVARVKKDETSVQKAVALSPRPEITKALGELKEENVQHTVEWLSSFPSRYNRLPEPNKHVNELETRLKAMLATYPGKFTVSQIEHESTGQHSLRVHLEGSKRPQEIVVLGGHLDSINRYWGDEAPGADDNASGSADLIEALRVLITKGVPERSVEFFWYAGEESGLLGSAEIARAYKEANKDVVAVLQLDMTLFPGAGEFVVGNVSDFTSPWLRSYLVALNDTYTQARLIDDKCGYACSDHASWYRQGYPTLMPFEADMERMNHNIHTEDDVISPSSSFRHAMVFAKIALVFAMDLGNSTARAPH